MRGDRTSQASRNVRDGKVMLGREVELQADFVTATLRAVA